jgi:hypothetical protein
MILPVDPRSPCLESRAVEIGSLPAHGHRSSDCLVTVANSFPVIPGGVGDHHLQVSATNHGRGPITVMAWGFRLPGDRQVLIPQQVAWSAALPHRLEPGAEASWFVEAAEIRRIAAEQGIPFKRFTAHVTLAGGQKATAKRGVPLA